jgi:hypothetical protein
MAPVAFDHHDSDHSDLGNRDLTLLRLATCSKAAARHGRRPARRRRSWRRSPGRSWRPLRLALPTTQERAVLPRTTERAAHPAFQPAARSLQWQRLRRAPLLCVWAVLALVFVASGSASAAVSASPVAPPGATGLQDLLNWTLYGGAIACAATAMYGFAKMGISHTQQSYQGANHGKSVAILGLVGALGLGLTPTVVNGLTAIH